MRYVQIVVAGELQSPPGVAAVSPRWVTGAVRGSNRRDSACRIACGYRREVSNTAMCTIPLYGSVDSAADLPWSGAERGGDPSAFRDEQSRVRIRRALCDRPRDGVGITKDYSVVEMPWRVGERWI
jgi:hypothetical protein